MIIPFISDRYTVLCFYLQAEVAEYHKIKLDLVELEKRMMLEITRPERILQYLVTGRLVCTVQKVNI